MGRRTLAGHKFLFHKLREKEQKASPADLGGIDLIDYFEAWAEGKKDGTIISLGNQSFLRVDRVERFSDRVVLVETMAGKAGEAGEVVDIESSEVRFSLTENDVPASSARALLFCPPRGEMALWFSEYSARSSGASMLLSLFDKEWRAVDQGFTMERTRLIASEIAVEDGIVTEVEVRYSKRADDRADSLTVDVGTVSHKFKPAKKSRLSGTIINTFRDNPAKAYELVELKSESVEEGEIFVSVDIDGRKRRIQIFNPDDGVYFREELNGSGHPILTDAELVRFCTEEAQTFFERSDLVWEGEWSSRRE